ncbi:hypothetical protein PHYPSEUDO_014201 [Phytophthora pseudosyringae]|uniref:Uncharacterized protein n=1 Tax=Phytophthora pseudosyringae TaxID=221518 RepID=A0A8T1V9A9_9STRA|nr:hypothetical protein PHYPSEUDO_014201 [Phytophthora pseudosyringae]
MKRVRDLSDSSGVPESKRPKSDQNELLNVVFRFKHKTPSDCQDEALCKTLVVKFAAFVAKLRPVTVSNHWCARVNPLVDDRVVPVCDFADHEVDVLQKVCRRLEAPGDGIHKRGQVWYDPWLPLYGCALQRTQVSAAVVKLEVIFVDGWERLLHFLPTGNCVHSAVAKTYHVLHCADLDSALEEKFGKMFETKLRKAQEGKGSKRNAAFNALGHQKTPQFIAAVVRRAVAVVTSLVDEDEDVGNNERFSPYGGTTDVGQHTGGRPRDTCWPLVQAAIAHNLCCGRGLFRNAMVLFELNFLQTTVDEAQGAFGRDLGVKDGCDSVDGIFFMLQVVVENAVELLESGYNVSTLQDLCTGLRATVDGFVDALNRQTALRFRLPDHTTMQQLSTLNCSVKIDSPKRDTELNADESSEARHARALANLEGCRLLDGVSCSLEALLAWERSNPAPKSYTCILVLRTFETFMFERSLQLTGHDGFEQPFDEDEHYVENMRSFVSTYQKVVCEWRQSLRMTSALDVEQRSREMLVTWVAFCLVHQKCVEEVPLCAKYSIALDWKDLEVAVLRDRAAISALERVAKYVRGWNAKANGLALFHLTNQGPTFDLGRRFGLNNAAMTDMYSREVESWEAHVRRKWNEVEQKKSRASELRADVTRLEEDLQSKKRELTSENAQLSEAYPPRQYAASYRESGAKAQFSADIQVTNSKLKTVKASLKKHATDQAQLMV